MQVMQKDFEVLLVSQFTLYGMMKGNKPDFHLAMPPTEVIDATIAFQSVPLELTGMP